MAEPANALAIEAARKASALIVASAITLYNWYNSRPKTAESADGSVPLIAFRAREYRGSTTEDLSYVGERSKEEVERACPRYPEVQERTAAAVMAIRGEERLSGRRYTPDEFGRRVHRHLQNQIDALHNPSFIAETTFSALEDEPKHGGLGSIRTDVFEELPNGTICVYDIKTGDATLRQARMQRIATAIKRKYGTTRTFIIIEVKPPKS